MVLASQTSSIKGLFSLEAKVQAVSRVPTHILYDQLFRVVIRFRRKAEVQRLTGKNVTSLPNYFKKKADLSDEQNQKITDIALEFMENVEDVDAQAMDVISQFRESYPDGDIYEGQEPPPPPPLELLNLQNQRNRLALNYREKLSISLGRQAFESFDRFIHNEFAKGFQASGKKTRD